MDPRNKPIWRVNSVDSPAASAELSFSPNRCAGWLLQSLRFLFVTSAVAATRVPTVRVTDGTTEWIRLVPVNGQVASATKLYTGWMGSCRGSEGGDVTTLDFPVPGLWIPQGHTLSTITANLSAGDQFSSISMSLWEFPTGPKTLQSPFMPTLLEGNE